MIATVDDLETIAGDDNADVPALKRGELALAVEKGRVVPVDRR